MTLHDFNSVLGNVRVKTASFISQSLHQGKSCQIDIMEIIDENYEKHFIFVPANCMLIVGEQEIRTDSVLRPEDIIEVEDAQWTMIISKNMPEPEGCEVEMETCYGRRYQWLPDGHIMPYREQSV